MRDIAKSELGAHLQAVHRLRLGAGVEQGPHAMWALGHRRLLRKNSDVDRLGGDMSQDAGGDGQRCPTNGLAGPMNENPLRGRCALGQYQDLFRPAPKQPFNLMSGISSRGYDRSTAE